MVTSFSLFPALCGSLLPVPHVLLVQAISGLSEGHGEILSTLW